MAKHLASLYGTEQDRVNVRLRPVVVGRVLVGERGQSERRTRPCSRP
jgi:hypothetical protein